MGTKGWEWRCSDVTSFLAWKVSQHSQLIWPAALPSPRALDLPCCFGNPPNFLPAWSRDLQPNAICSRRGPQMSLVSQEVRKPGSALVRGCPSARLPLLPDDQHSLPSASQLPPATVSWSDLGTLGLVSSYNPTGEVVKLE